MNYKKLLLILPIVLIFSALNFSSVQGNKPSMLFDIQKVGAKNHGQTIDFTFDYNGKETSFTDLVKGKAVFLNVWGSWCPPCRKEIPYIVDITNELSKEDFIVIGIARERSPEKARETLTSFIASNNINYINFIGNDNITNQILKHYEVQFFPTTFIIDKSGNINEKIVGGRTKEQFLESIRRVL